MSKPKGVGVHVFAGGFTMGVKRVLPVAGQLEIHDFGRETCEAHGTPFMNADSWHGWDEYKSKWNGCSFCYGNPRCTAFSGYSSGASAKARGPNAAPTQDIWDLCRFGVHAEFELVAFESVQQAYSVGKLLLCRLREELFEPNRYRIAHVFVNTAAEGNAQRRQRYFFVAYKDHRNFNVYKPNLPKYRVTVGDVLGKPEHRNRRLTPSNLSGKLVNYDAGYYHAFRGEIFDAIKCLREGESFHALAKNRPDELEKASAKLYDKWLLRTSGLPFSLHCPRRLKWDGSCPTISSTSKSYIHPLEDRGLSIGELAALMGWPDGFIPRGPKPVGQIGKGVVPATGAWLAEQIEAYFDDDWGDDDFDVAYCHKSDAWYGTDWSRKASKPLEKVFQLTHYLPPFKETARCGNTLT